MRYKIIFSLIFVVLLIGIVSAETSYCCEKTTYGASCQNENESKCSTEINPNTGENYQKSPTHCDSTNFCRRGCCYNSNEGNCVPNTAEGPCLDDGGTWENKNDCDIPQCQVGCCLLGNQATFVTQTRCKRLATLYGIGINFKQNIKDEFECISQITSHEEGACVLERDFERTCSILTREDCLKQGSEVEFYQGRLCSDETLNTICGPSDRTTCVEGKDPVYYLDTCGNLANVYDSTKRISPNYWAEMTDISESCGFEENVANSETCGNCDYYLGSTCREYNPNVDTTAPPKLGDHICRDLSCTYQGKKYNHGERWCSTFGGVSNISAEDISTYNANSVVENVPGSRYYRLLCYNAKVTIEPCGEYRNQICVQDEVNGFKTAECRINRWSYCYIQTNEGDCLDDSMDCKWGSGKCMPRYAPGFKFWDPAAMEDARNTCSLATEKCIVRWDYKIGSGWEPDRNDHCRHAPWREAKMEYCSSLGDCGSSTNYLGFEGSHSLSDLYYRNDARVEGEDVGNL